LKNTVIPSPENPANHNAVALILPHKSLLSFNGGAIGADIYCDRAGILARTLAAAAEIKSILGEKLGATLVESSDPLWERDRDLEQMNPDSSRRSPGSCRYSCPICCFG
jgi:hypothetical protein